VFVDPEFVTSYRRCRTAGVLDLAMPAAKSHKILFFLATALRSSPTVQMSRTAVTGRLSPPPTEGGGLKSFALFVKQIGLYSDDPSLPSVLRRLGAGWGSHVNPSRRPSVRLQFIQYRTLVRTVLSVSSKVCTLFLTFGAVKKQVQRLGFA
jgi:hypothetical protein